MKLYVVTMYRYGDRQKHSYVLGVWDTEEDANLFAKTEEAYRGYPKYQAEILPVELNKELYGNKKIRTI